MAHIKAFPTLRWFSQGHMVAPDYKMDRTVPALTRFAQRRIQPLLYVIPLTPDTFDDLNEKHMRFFVQFHWGVAEDVAVWTELAQVVTDRQLGVEMASSDCRSYRAWCESNNYLPGMSTLRWCQDGDCVEPDDQGGRTVAVMLGYIERRVDRDREHEVMENDRRAVELARKMQSF
jgi:hypothetical protein